MHAPRHKSSLQRRFKMASSENILREKDFRDRDQLNMRENKKTPQRKKKKKTRKMQRENLQLLAHRVSTVSAALRLFILLTFSPF